MNAPRATFALALVGSALLGALGYASLTLWYAYDKSVKDNIRLRAVAATPSLYTHGIVEGIDTASGSVTMRVRRVGEEVSLTFRITPETYVAKQFLIGEGGTYSGVSDPSPAALSDVKIGDRIAVLRDALQPGFTALVILFGNPL